MEVERIFLLFCCDRKLNSRNQSYSREIITRQAILFLLKTLRLHKVVMEAGEVFLLIFITTKSENKKPKLFKRKCLLMYKLSYFFCGKFTFTQGC